MTKLLLKLWFDQKRRDFKWGRFFGEAYFFALFIAVSVAVTLVVYEETDSLEGAEIAVPMIAVAIIIPDFLNKLVMKHDETVMDHYLKSKPIPEQSWNRFLLIINLFSFWNWAIPLCLVAFCVLFLPWTLALPSFLLFLAVSMVGGVAMTAFCRAKGWTNKWPVLVAMLMWFAFASMYAPLLAIMPWGLHVAGFLLLCVGGIMVFYNYLCSLRRYDESQRKKGWLFLKGSSSLMSMEYLCLLRSKRLRVAALVLPLVFVFNVYTQLINGLNFMFYLMLLFEVFAPSMMLGQWIFGAEGNFFDGLWSKPVDIRQILYNKYWFYALLNAVALLFVIPVLWLCDLSPWALVATWLFVAGMCNLTMFPTALISSRIELFQSAFFNYQGASLAVNLYGLIFIIPMAGYCACMALLPIETAVLILSALGVVGFALHRVVIDWLAGIYERRRYICFERYRQ